MTLVFKRRYLFRGTLTLKTGLHIGGGWISGSASDSPVIRTPDGRPFIPGSSFKGAFRSTVEKLAATVGLSSCGLRGGQGCIGAQGQEQKDFNDRRRDDDDWNDEQLLNELEGGLCETCKLFGSPYMASKITFADLLPPEGDNLADKMIQVRDGVAIDRDSEKAMDRLKYDYEVVAPAQTFGVEILLHNPTAIDLQLTCLGVSEFASGLGYIGGNRSRGLGNCHLIDLEIYSLDLTINDPTERARRLKTYLLGRTPDKKMNQESSPQDFLDQQITALLTAQEGTNA